MRVFWFVVGSLALAAATVYYSEPSPPGVAVSSAFDLGSAGGVASSPASLPASVLAATSTTTTQTAATTPSRGADELAESEGFLAGVPDEILEPLGGRDAVRLVVHDTVDSGLEGWTGGVANFTDGLAVLGKGLATWSYPLTPPFAIVGRVSYSDGGFFEIFVEDGVWATPSLRRWGFFGQDDQIVPNIYEGNQEMAPTNAAPVTVEAGTWYWIVLAVNPDSGMYGVWAEGSNDAAVGVTGPIDWDSTEYSLGIQVFSGGGLVTIDEHHLLVP